MILEENARELLKNALIRAEIDGIFLEPVEKYLTFLMEKNLDLNLISRKMSVEVVIEDHILDCLWGVPFFKDYNFITDLGTGGGLPGLLLALLFPEKKIDLVEKSPKKSIFLKQAIKHLNLTNTSLRMGLVDQEDIEGEVITCRAFKPIPVILQMTESFFRKGGTYILYKAREEKIKEEAALIGNQFSYSLVNHRITAVTEKERYITVIKPRIPD